MELKRANLSSIEKMRKKLGLTQKQLANISGVSQSLIAKIESGKIDPSYSNVVKIISALESEGSKTSRKVNEIMTNRIISISPSDKVSGAMRLMEKEDISQLPVFSKDVCVGSISDSMFVEWFSKYGTRIKKLKVSDVMGESFPTVPYNSDVDVVVHLLKFYRAVLVKKNGKIAGIVTKADMIKAME